MGCGGQGDAAAVSRPASSVCVRSGCVAAAARRAAQANAHTGGTTGFATVTVSGQTVRYSLALAMTSDHSAAGRRDAPRASRAARPTISRCSRAAEQKIKVSIQRSARCEPAPGHIITAVVEGANIVDRSVLRVRAGTAGADDPRRPVRRAGHGLSHARQNRMAGRNAAVRVSARPRETHASRSRLTVSRRAASAASFCSASSTF